MKLSSEGMSRRGFLRRAGLAGAGGMALAAFGEGIGVKAAGAAVVPKTKRKETVLWQGSATACPGCILTCTTAEGHCGSPCTPTGTAYCFHCVESGSCSGSYYQCQDRQPGTYIICIDS